MRGGLATIVWLATVVWVAVASSGLARGAMPVQGEFEEAQARLFSGKYEEAIEEAEIAIGGGDTGERWFLLKLECQMATGKYARALETLEEGIDSNPNSIRLRLAGFEVWKHNNNLQRARELLIELDDLVQYRRWRYRDALSQVTQGRYQLLLRADARKVLDDFLLPAIRKAPRSAEACLAVGDLGLAKHDYALAAEYYRQATELQPQNPAGFLGLARAWRPSDLEKSSQAIARAMELNPDLVAGLHYLIEDRIDSERYDESVGFIEQIHQINPRDPPAWAYRAVIAHLQNDPDLEAECRQQAFEPWAANPEVDYLIGKKLSQKYRFAEGARLQRRALVNDPNFLPAKIQLANDLLRLGNDQEGWRLAEEVYQKDGYHVVAYNLVTLGNDLSKYTVLDRDGFIVRMEPREAAIYGEMVLELLSEARQVLGEKYDVQVPGPVFVEIFPKPQDFAIRTFGLPGGSGYLGVCFGRVITMNSPKTQSRSNSNWKSVLWHEFCHVVTLQKTGNKMPRWLSEGISVYEEQQRNRAWGQSMTPAFRERLLSDDLTPVSQLSAAFLSPESGQDLQFAYYQSSLVVEYLVEKYGLETLRKILDDLKIGIPVNEVLGRYTGDVRLLDKEFAAYARQRAGDLAPQVGWERPDIAPPGTLPQWKKWNADHPDNFYGLKAEAALLIQSGEWERAEEVTSRLIEIFPEYRQADNGYSMKAAIARARDDSQKEYEMLKKSAELQAAATDLYPRLIELSTARQNWDDVLLQAGRWLAVNPLVPAPHRALAGAAEQMDDFQTAAPALRALVEMDPLDPAETHYRYAVALHRTGQAELARRQVLKCLEEAPRYRDAHKLLLELSRQRQPLSGSDSRPPNQKHSSQDEDQ